MTPIGKVFSFISFILCVGFIAFYEYPENEDEFYEKEVITFSHNSLIIYEGDSVLKAFYKNDTINIYSIDSTIYVEDTKADKWIYKCTSNQIGNYSRLVFSNEKINEQKIIAVHNPKQ